MIPPTYLPHPRHGAAAAVLVLAVAAVIDAVLGIGPVGYQHHATDGQVVETEVHDGPRDGTFREQDLTRDLTRDLAPVPQSSTDAATGR